MKRDDSFAGLDKKEQKKEAILKIAQDVFSKNGYRKTTIDEIATATKKGKSSLYYYFSSKEELFNEVILWEVELLKNELTRVINRNITPVEKLREYIITKLMTFRSLSNLYNTLGKDEPAKEFIDQIMGKYYKEEIRMIKRILIEGVRQGEFEVYDFSLAATGITTAIKGLEIPLSAGSYGHANLSESVDNIIKIICYGIVKRQ
ncbi:MAG: TetR/AcrR family transcriptional regulator [Bacteroidales bacterium]